MRDLSIICAFTICACVLLLAFAHKPEYMSDKASDGIKYNVLTSYSDTKEAMEKLARVNARTLMFLEYLKRKYNINNTTVDANGDNVIDEADNQLNSVIVPHTTQTQRQLVQRLLSNYNFESIYETVPTGKNGTSYTIEKGEQLHMCLRDKETGQLHSDDDIMFVTIHELAHMANPTWGHGDDYWEVFKFLLTEAASNNTLIPIDYSKKPMIYCGLKVDWNPMF